MKLTEAAALLTVAASFDNRKPDEDQATAWALALDGLRFTDCRAVIVSHYQRSREWLMPVDVIGGVRRLRDKRINDYGPIELPADLDPDDTGAYVKAVTDMQRAIADGDLTRSTVAAGIAGRDVVRELGHIGRRVPTS